MKIFTLIQFKPTLFAVALAAVMLLPTVTNAAEVGPVCVMLLKTTAGTVMGPGEHEVMLNKGDSLHILWLSANAAAAENINGNRVPLSGRTVKTPTKKTTYSYTFSKNNREVTCAVTVHPTDGHITASTLSSLSKTPTLEGEVAGTEHVSLKVFKPGSKVAFYASGVVKVDEGKWEHAISKTLPRGTYDVVLYGNGELTLNAIAKRTLTIGPATDSDAQTSTVVVQSIPLLVGGVAKKNQTIGLSYLQVLNVGLKSATITGVRVEQKGTASTDTVLSLQAIDDTELAKGQVGNVGASLFDSNEALIPITFTLKSKETRLLTLKATMAGDVSDEVGNTLKLVVSGVDSRSSVKGAFPIRGVTWTIGK